MSAADATITERLFRGDRGALARLITWAENDDPRFADAQREIHGHAGRAWRVGVTGPPGCGKSTLTGELARLLRAEDRTVGILAVDPSSPYSGGALLGDRIRMEERTLDRGSYVRSMASRGSHGGLARAAVDACDVMDAFGFDVVLVETVGVGQAEYDVLRAADTVLVVLCPGAGDGIQAMKAGLLEVADVLVVNKADLDGADQLALDLEEAVRSRVLSRADRGGGAPWEVPVVSCSAKARRDVQGVLAAVRAHRAHLEQGRLAGVRRARAARQVQNIVNERLLEALWTSEGVDDRVAEQLARSATPYDVARRILEPILAAIPYPSRRDPVSGGRA